MAQHISRKELKKDEIRETFVHGAEAVVSNQGHIWLFGGVALVIVFAVLGWRFYTQRQTARANAALADGMKTYEAPIRAANEPVTPDELTYGDEKTKFADASKKLTAVADQYARTRPGQLARYYAALSLEQSDNYDQAEKNLKTLESSSDEGLAALARFQLAQIYDKTNRGAQALPLYQQLSDKPSLFVPKPVVLLSLADHYAATDPAQAAKLYKQIKTDFPDSQAAQLADQRLQLLPTKS